VLLNTYASPSFGTTVNGVAVDGNGVVYAAYEGSSSASIALLSSPTYTAGTTIPIPSPSPFVLPSGPSVVSISVAVLPAAGILGNRSGGESPTPISTASPAAAHRRP
jgi:streptogramin lyase